MTTITTAEELDALPEQTVGIPENLEVRTELGVFEKDRRGDWRNAEKGVLTSGRVVREVGPLTVLYNPDQPVSAAPTVEQIAKVLRTHDIECTGLGEVSCRGCRDAGWMSWHSYRTHVAEAVRKLYPTCQPSREVVGKAIDKGYYEDDEADGSVAFDGDVALSAVMKTLPGRPEAEVKAEALEEYAALRESLADDTPLSGFAEMVVQEDLHARAAALRAER